MCFRVLGKALYMLNAVCMDSSRVVRCTACGSFKFSWDHKRPRLTCFFSLPNAILLYGCTAIYVPAHVLMNALASSHLGLVLAKQKWIFGFKSLYRHTCPFLLGRYLGMKSPSHMVGVCPQTLWTEAVSCRFPGDNVRDAQFLLAFINTYIISLLNFSYSMSMKWHIFWLWGVSKCTL